MNTPDDVQMLSVAVMCSLLPREAGGLKTGSDEPIKHTHTSAELNREDLEVKMPFILCIQILIVGYQIVKRWYMIL